MRVTRAVAGAVLAVTLFAGGCSSDGDGGDAAARSTFTTATESQPETTVDPAAVPVAQQYLEALTADGGPDLEAMTAVSAPDSVAEHYAVHTAAVAEVQAASGEAAGGGEVTVDGDTVIATLVGSSGSSVDTTWADFSLDDEGRLVDFTIDGTPLDDRLIVGGASETDARVTATVVSAFRLVSNDSPVVIVEIDNGARRPYRLAGAAYGQGPEDLQSSRPEGLGLTVAPGTTGRAVVVLAPAPFGGTLRLQGRLGGAQGVPVRHDLPLTP